MEIPENPSEVEQYPKFEHIYYLIEIQAELRPDATVIAAPGRISLTYGKLRRQIDYVIKVLNTVGIGRNDRVAIVLPNGPEMAVSFLGVTACATSAPLNPAYQGEEFDFYLSDMNAQALIVQVGIESPARVVAQARGMTLIELQPVLEAESGMFTLTSDASSHTTNPGRAQPSDIALVLHTSGTTSRPKLVPLTQTNLCSSICNIGKSLELLDSDRCLNVMPLFHAHAIMTPLLASLVAGGSVVCTPGFDVSKFFDWMEEFQPSWYSAVPTIHQAILGRIARSQEITLPPSLRFVRSCSSSLPPQVFADLKRVFKVPVIEAYGMTEACSVVTSNPLPPGEQKVGSVGIEIGTDVAIMDETGNLLPPGKVGEIVIRGTSVMGEYENNPAANEAAFTKGWFRTGDQGFSDEDGYLFITGRIKEVINRGGRKLSPLGVDQVLLEYPDIRQAVTFAVPHPTLGEDVVAVVVLQDNASATEREIRRFASTRLADYKIPSQVLVVDEIPKSSTGKIQRIGMAEKLAPMLKAEFVSPRNPVEEALAKIWTEILGVEEVGIDDNFFALGGNSLLLAQVHSRIQKEFGQNLTIVDLFEYTTIRSLTKHLSQTRSELSSSQHHDEQVEKLRAGKDRLRRQLGQRQRSVKR